jgi:hypothetical protein
MLPSIFGSLLEVVITAEARTACAIDLRFLLHAFEIRSNRPEPQPQSAATRKRDLGGPGFRPLLHAAKKRSGQIVVRQF